MSLVLQFSRFHRNKIDISTAGQNFLIKRAYLKWTVIGA